MDPSRPYHHLPLPSNTNTRDIFRASTTWTVGDGRTYRFWLDHWIDGRSISEITPTLAALVPHRCRNRRLVYEGLHQRSWIRDIRGALGAVATVEYISLWRRLRHVDLSTEPDSICWR